MKEMLCLCVNLKCILYILRNILTLNRTSSHHVVEPFREFQFPKHSSVFTSKSWLLQRCRWLDTSFFSPSSSTSSSSVSSHQFLDTIFRVKFHLNNHILHLHLLDHYTVVTCQWHKLRSVSEQISLNRCLNCVAKLCHIFETIDEWF